MADSSASGHPTGRRRRKCKSPAAQAAVELPLPRLPDQLDESSDSDAEKDAKGPRSTSTTPRSGKGLQPDVMGIGSVELKFQFTSEEERDGDGELFDSEIPRMGVADYSTTQIDSCPGAVESSKGLVVRV